MRFVGLMLLCGLCLQLYFVLRIALMIVIDPQSTTFERSEMWRLMREPGGSLSWRQTWVGDSHLSVHLKRAVISSEDASFIEHNGVDWDALRNAWERNRRAEARAERLNQQLERRQETGGHAEQNQRQDHRRLDHHPTVGEEPVFVGRAHIAAQSAGVPHHLHAGRFAEQTPHPHHLPEPR
jgi:hypothetical protein